VAANKAMRATAVLLLILFVGLAAFHGGLAARPAHAEGDAFDDPFADGGGGGDKPSGGDDKPSGGDEGGGESGGGSGGATGGGSTGGSASGPATHEDEQMKPYKPRDASATEPKDPFEPKIEPPMPVVAPTSATPVVQQKKEIPPLPISVSFIVGSEANRMALLELNGKPYEMRAGEAEEGGLFKVLEITEKEVTIYDSRVQKNRVIKLADN